MEKNSGISFFDALQIVFITLKLVGVISWSWFFVLLPVIIDAFLFVVYAIITILQQ